MNLAELLLHTGKDYLDDRVDLLDGDPDSLYSDALLVRYFNEAQRILCRRSWVLIDYGVPPAGVIVLAVNKVLYPLHASVLFVFDATPSTQTYPMGRGSDLDLRDPYPRGMDAFDMGEASALAGADTYTGSPLAFSTDVATRTIRVSPTPAADQANLRVDLRIAHLPIKDLTLDDLEAEPEIPAEYHLWLCDYAAGRCLAQPNVDGAQKVEGRAMLDEFAAHVKEARQERQRASAGGDRWGFASATART